MKLLSYLLLFPSVFFAVSYQEALSKLKEGNLRFVNNKSPGCFCGQSDKRVALSNSQKPFAVILACSDSRVAPEILFDQGLGDLFIIRVAGNVLGPSEIDSITYAIKVLGSNLIVVLGHENCGAVNAVWKKQADIIPYVKKEIYPAIDFKNPHCTLECQIKNNVHHIVDELNKSAQFSGEVKADKIKVQGAYYPFSTGQVGFFD